jgi:hypothetical protein
MADKAKVELLTPFYGLAIIAPFGRRRRHY